LLFQGNTLQSAGARHRSATCFCVPPRFTYHARPRRAAGGAAGYGGGAAAWVQCFWCALFSRRQRLDARRPPRTHSRDILAPFTLPDGAQAVGSTAHDSCCSSCHHIDRRLDLGLAPLALACRRWPQHNHRALHGAAAARVRVCQSLGVKRHRSSRRGTVLRRSTADFVAPPPAPCGARAASAQVTAAPPLMSCTAGARTTALHALAAAHARRRCGLILFVF